MENKKIELLSPAKNLELGKIAINFGADAVYIGANKFGARKSAGNSVSDIEILSRYAHKFDAKVYVTLNTILFDNELEEARRLVWQIYESGVDALIIQDFALFEMDLPPIPLHSSTQMNNIDLDKIKFYEKIGFQRVILARELSLYQIAEINKHTTIELESFVHGAICVSYSGQCYMSAYIGGRSGNRGECAQPCRLKYDLLDTKKNVVLKNKHLLSIKDMNRSDYLEDMLNVGVTSFKIEGRLKDENYVKNVTAFYRKKLDSILQNNMNLNRLSRGMFVFNFEPDLEKTFNRAYTDYFLSGKRKKINSATSKSLGKRLGKVSISTDKYIVIDTKEKINTGDGLCYFDKNGQLQGFSVNKLENNKIFSSKHLDLQVGTEIYRNFDINFNKKLQQIDNCRYVLVELFFSQTENGFVLKAKTIEGDYVVQKELFFKKEPAQKPQKHIENIKKQLQKTGNTIFKIEKLKIELDEVYFLPISLLNKFRREVFADLYEQLGKKYVRNLIERKELTDIKYYLEEVDYRANISNHLSEKFYKKYGVKIIEKAFELSNNHSSKVLMTTKYCLRYELGQCPRFQHFDRKSDIKYLKYGDKVFELVFDCKKCQMEIRSIE